MSDETNEDCVRWSRADLALARRAARERWGVPDEMRTEALWQALRTLTDPEASHRERYAASSLILQADKHDLAEDKHDHAVGRSSGAPETKPRLIIPGSDARSEPRPEDPG